MHYSLDTLCDIASFWPSRVALAFVTSQPRCRIAAEVYATEASRNRPRTTQRGAGRAAQRAGNAEVQDAWTTWAAQLPFGEWWVSHLAQAAMPSDELPFRSNRFIEAANDYAVPLAARWCGMEQPTRFPSPPPPSNALHAPASALEFMSEHHAHYRAYREYRSATTTQFQAGVRDRWAAEAGVSWADCPYPGERLWGVSVKSGYAGGVHVGHLVSFLVPVSHCCSADLADGSRWGFHGAQRCDASEKVPLRRVLHWDVRADELSGQRAMCRTHRSPVGQGVGTDEVIALATVSSGTNLTFVPSQSFSPRVEPAQRGPLDAPTQVTDAAAVGPPASIQRSSWSYSYWWFRRPLCLSRVPSTVAPCGGAPNLAEGSTHPCSTQGVAEASLYAYGSHPASLPCHLEVDCRESASCNSISHAHLPRGAAAAAAAAPSPSPQTAHEPCAGCAAAFVTSLHLYDCPPSPPPTTDSALSPSSPPLPLLSTSPPPGGSGGDDALRSWWGALASNGCSCCDRLSRLEIDFDGYRGASGDASAPGRHTGNAGDAGPPSAEASTDAATSNVQRPFHEGEIVGMPAAHADPSPFRAAASTGAAVSAAVPVRAVHMGFLTDVRLAGSDLSDVNFLGTLRHLCLADVSRSRRLTDRGVVGVARSTSLCVLDLSFCTLVDTAAVPLAAMATLEELYLTGTAVTDATLRAIAGPPPPPLQHHRSQRLEATTASAPPSRMLRVLHVDACRHAQDPFDAFMVDHTLRSPSLQGGGDRWDGLAEFIASAAPSSSLRQQSRPSSGEERDEEADDVASSEEDGTTDASLESLQEHASAASESDGGVSLEVRLSPSHTSEEAPQQTHVSFNPSRVAAVPSSSGAWQALTTIELHNTILHCLLGDLGVLSSLRRLSLLRCSTTSTRGRHRRPPYRLPWLTGLERCSLLHTVLLEDCDAALTHAGNMHVLAQLPSLQNLSLHRARVRDADVRTLVQALFQSPGGQRSSRCALQRLSLALCGRLTHHLCTVATLTSVRTLDLSDTAAAQDLVDLLGTCATHHSLQVLQLAACASITSVNPLAAMKELLRLDVSHTPVTTAGVAELRRCRALTHLNLKGCAGVAHMRDVLAIPTLQVLNAQGTGLHEELLTTEDEESTDSAEGQGSSNLAVRDEEGRQTTYRDLFPPEDDLLRRSALHTLLLSHTRVRRIRRLGLLPWLMCLDIGATCVTDAELVKFVCTGIRQSQPTPPRGTADKAKTRAEDVTSRWSSAGSAVVHRLRDLCRVGESLSSPYLLPNHGGPPLRVLSLQLCRFIFTVGVLGLCPRLTKLDLSSSNVTSRGLVGLHRSRSLVQLRLVGCKGIHDVRLLACIASLREVDGSGCNVHGDRLMGHSCNSAGAADTGEAGATATPSSHLVPLHSDLFSTVHRQSVETSGLQRLVEGEEGHAAAALSTPAGSLLLSPTPALSLRRVYAPQLRRLVLDGCANLHGGLAALGGLPALADLSLRNCHGITAASVAELGERRTQEGDDDDEEAGEGLNGSRTKGELRFPALQSIRFSSCRLLTGSLKELEALPQLQHVYADQCGISSLDDVAPSLRRRVTL
ncbi:hypothetical protein ABB37_05951 [Leptomonas pyrrhocoris]|uniref:Leucine-rich repeat protein n=1 Tax=Leptomonas pyrrhocoris TaxID=157538 RepID=A0A0M9FZ44_LEPPY|nr:hypothetical protein ABB37_05951 [Leptomonas pyrrhocoris]KPA78887.1 hypothetical protein ABB37_05951 [Leptomonas pyrrhocoris]|eukprot:XP_015657326.1 hypothetical protein ABB37_05951 [Leptomonas pyrrhocoris]